MALSPRTEGVRTDLLGALLRGLISSHEEARRGVSSVERYLLNAMCHAEAPWHRETDESFFAR